MNAFAKRAPPWCNAVQNNIASLALTNAVPGSTRMRLIAFIAEGTQIRNSLDHIGVDLESPHFSLARGPPLWDDCSDAQTDEGEHIEPDGSSGATGTGLWG